MNIKDIAQAKTVKRTIQLDNDQTVDVYLRQMPFYLFWDGKDEKGNVLSDDQLIARRIAYCVVDEKNEPIFTYEQVIGTDPDYQLDTYFTLKLGNLIAEENNVGKLLKDSNSEMNSGAN